MSTNSVFMKKPAQANKMSYEEILKTIPPNSFGKPQSDKNNKIEIRWRFLNIPSSSPNKYKKIVEISKRHPNSSRKYLNKDNMWTDTVVDPYFDQFVVEQYYYYSDK
jgi:hypothetical protein